MNPGKSRTTGEGCEAAYYYIWKTISNGDADSFLEDLNDDEVEEFWATVEKVMAEMREGMKRG